MARNGGNAGIPGAAVGLVLFAVVIVVLLLLT